MAHQCSPTDDCECAEPQTPWRFCPIHGDFPTRLARCQCGRYCRRH